MLHWKIWAIWEWIRVECCLMKHGLSKDIPEFTNQKITRGTQELAQLD